MVYMASVKKSGTLTWTNIVLHSTIILLGASNFIAQFFIWIERWSLWPAAGWRQQTRCQFKYKWEFAKSQENEQPLVFTPQKDLVGGYDKLSNNNLPNGCVLSNPNRSISYILGPLFLWQPLLGVFNTIHVILSFVVELSSNIFSNNVIVDAFYFRRL